MKKVDTKIMSLSLAMGIAFGVLIPVTIQSAAISLMGTGIYFGCNRHQFSVHHSSLGLLSVQSSSNTARSSTLTLYKGTARIGTVSYFPASYLTNPLVAKLHRIKPDQLALFKQEARGSLDKYAYIYWFYIDPKYRNKNDHLKKFLNEAVLRQELIKRNYTGLCFTAGPFEYGNLLMKNEKNLEEYNRKLRDLLQVYKYLGITPLSEPNPTTIATVPCIQHQLNSVPLPEGISLSNAPIEKSTRLLQFWDHYRGQIFLGIIAGALAVHRALR